MPSNRPDLSLFVAFNADPFDTTATPLWSDLTTRCYGINSAKRGRQYELDRNQNGSLDAAWHNADEALNPVNTGSPYSPNVLPYRQIVAMATWPPTPVGAATNALWAQGIDPSFESYAAGFVPDWLGGLGAGVLPSVVNGTFFEGSKSLGYAVNVGGDTSGVGFPVTCIPGRQYTSSAYVIQQFANTQRIRVSGLTALDRFQRTGALSGSTADTGQTWSVANGTSGDYTTSGGTMLIANGSANVSRFATLGVNAADFDVRVPITVPALATGQTYVASIVGRYTDPGNQYRFELNFNTNGTVDADILKLVGNVGSQVGATVSNIFSYTAGTKVWLRAQGSGTSLLLTAWLDGAVPPVTETLFVIDGSLTAGQIGICNQRISGNTNSTLTITHGPLSVTSYSTFGTSTTSTAYTRLSVTYVATQPQHFIWVLTDPSLTSLVNIDAIQHEPGAVTTAFAYSGQTIRSIWTRGYVERWPQAWTDNGFRGISGTPCVGPLAILANANLHTELRGSIQAKAPDYYWALQEPSDATAFAETSGHNGPPLVKTNSTSGPGPTYAPGTDMKIPGDAGGVGVQTAPNPGDEGLQNVPFTILQLGYTGPRLIGPTAPPASNANWSCSMSVVLTRPAVVAVGGEKFVRFVTPLNSSPLGISQGNSSQIFAPFTNSVPDLWGDGKPHLYVVTTTQAVPNMFSSMYVDGVLVASQTTPGFTVGFDFPELLVNVGGASTYTFNQAGANQTISHLAYWNRELSTNEIDDLYAAFNGYPGETSGQRISRYLGLAGYTGPANIQTGASTMGPGTVKEGDGVLDTCQRVSDSEFGNFYEDGNGLAFAGRFDRYLRTTSAFTFGENVAAGEYPYEGDIMFDIDPTLVLNVADVTRTGGVKVHAEDATGVSQKRYGRKAFSRTIDIASDDETYDAATWVIANRKDPLNRVAAVTFNPARVPGLPFGDGTMWPMVLALEIGTRVTVKRRPKAANGGAGITISGDFFVENIEHRNINFAAGTWETVLLLSPVNKAQPWILGNATYGLLGTTTVLGF